MSQAEKLKKIFEYAEKEGWDKPVTENICILLATYPILIFSHSFLKAFFGERIENELISVPGISRLIRGVISWQYQGGKLVIIPEEKRIDYLYDFIKER
ncbi:MAG: hypothetical protein ACTSWK_17720 [Promethearchaeota archaeon]